jgi:hypothetical protein
MPGDTQTGMEQAEMKRFLLKSKQEPVNCALGVGDDKSVALLMLSPHRSAKSLQGDLQKQFPSAFNTRFGTAVVDTDDDPTLVKFMLNKPVTSMARRLVKTLKGTGFRKVQILLEDGTPVETAAEEAGVGVAADGQVVEADARPDAGALQNELAVLVQRIKDVADPAMKARLAKLATDTNVNIKTNNLTYAATYLAQLRNGLAARETTPDNNAAGGGELVPPPPPPEAQAKRDPSALTAELTALVRRIPEVVAADPPRKETLATLARQAQVNLKTGNLTYAAADIESLRRAMEAGPTVSGTAPTSGASPSATPGQPFYDKARVAWVATRNKVQSDVETLRKAILSTYSDRATELDGQFQARVAPLLGTLDESLADKLDAASNAADAQQRSELVEEARQIIERHRDYLAASPIIADLDANPFVPLAIQKTVATTLAALSNTVR